MLIGDETPEASTVIEEQPSLLKPDTRIRMPVLIVRDT